MKLVYLLAIPLLFLASCTSSTTDDTTTKVVNTASWTVYTNTGISVNYPIEWNLDAEGKFGTQFFIFSPAEGSGDVFQENVNLVTEDLTQKPMTLDEYGQSNVEQIKTVISNATIIANEKKTDSKGNEYYLAQYKGKQGSVNLEFIQYYRIKNNIAYVLTLTLEDKADNIYKNVGESILDTAVLQ